MRIVKINSGLGNQMFQYAFYIMLKNKIKTKSIIIENGYFEYNNIHNGFELERIFGLKVNNNKYINIFFNSKNYFIKILRKLFKLFYKRFILEQKDTVYVKDEVILRKKIFLGYWQSEKYFKNIEKEIKEIYSFPELDIKNKKIKDKIEIENSISIHVRRNDYVNHLTLGGMVTSTYYELALQMIEKLVDQPKYYIFSDDIEWCKKELNLLGRDVTFISHNKGEDSYKDMHLMSLCKHNIIPNSSFSWWGAWLNKNPNKIVIAPKYWFTKESKYRYEDIVPESWLKIENK